MCVRIPCEDDLNSTVSDTFAMAAIQCQHAGGYCVQDGYCHFGGSCFVNQDLTPEQMLHELQFMKNELRDARAKASDAEARESRLIIKLKSSCDAARKKGNSERALALSWAATQLSKQN